MSNDEHPATRANLPETGPGSPASWPRRIAALVIDWAAGNVIAYAVGGGSAVWDAQAGRMWLPLACWYLLVVAFTAVTGSSLGQGLLRIRVTHLDGRRPSLVTATVRTALIALVIPPLVFTREGRGLHDLASNTAVVNAG